ncbi:hypothetical protein KNU49_gp103 [Streptomyces phage EGole]|uniref:Uncharacterized protein n=1 Tax=Streptomyces phage EGole TaxID=2517973 RepID=A0A482JG29_9CAUD|nr:hypothetical protein KNU49_gp103 [Streptomyces phage EGole]QBP30951.1 hypothetical protein SEA_EGOLE_209 [Streptomyces phage EGole]
MTYTGFPKLPNNFRLERDANKPQVVLKKKGLLGWREVSRETVFGIVSYPIKDELYFLTGHVMWDVYRRINDI